MARGSHLGIDIGGTTIKLGLCRADGVPLARAAVLTDVERGPEHALRRVADAARALLEHPSDVAVCGVGAPGEIDRARGTLVRANHLPGWTNVPVAERLAAMLSVPVVLENDANCATWGERCAGVGRGARGLVCFTLGTGVGGGVVVDDDLWLGAGGAAGALGHIVVDPNGPECGCGQRGCVEQYASATALARRFGRGTAREAFDAATRGEADAIAAVEWACDGLAAAVATVIHVLQPEVVVMAGGMAGAGDALLRRVRDGVSRRVRPAWLAPVRIATSALGGDAGWTGAALWGARQARRREHTGRHSSAVES